ncbi:MAG: hypothetical protein M3O34_19060 [Chloroflexota bacterium]|nr:hypothetical protein [Chloroflexota bacterium]
MTADDLAGWIAELRDRVARGELAGLGRIDMHGAMVPVELVVRIMLADLDDLDAEDVIPEQRHDPYAARRRQALLRDFRRLREQID